ncbi:MAG TPA: hypothetical protein VIL86_07610 [Tepidisphaeraceae bacterium]|jgi:hypothetical protein
MWGNRLGWGISGAIVIGALGVYALIVLAMKPSPPTAFITGHPDYLTRVELPVDPRTVVKVMTDDCDAGPMYREAINDVGRHQVLYDQFGEGRAPMERVGELKGVDNLLKAAKCKRMTLFSANPKEVVNYIGEREPIEALAKVAKAAIAIGLRSKEKDPETARKYYEAAFSLGTKMYEERVVYEELQVGIDLLGTAASALKSLVKEKDPAAADALGNFDASKLEYFQNRIAPVMRVISSIDPNVQFQHTGDVFKLASPDNEEKMFRTEAVLKLGRQKYFAARSADQWGARRILRKYAQDDDPAISTAAQLGLDLTLEGYRALH